MNVHVTVEHIKFETPSLDADSVVRLYNLLFVVVLTEVSVCGCCGWGTERSWSGNPGWVWRDERPLWEGRLV